MGLVRRLGTSLYFTLLTAGMLSAGIALDALGGFGAARRPTTALRLGTALP